MIEDQRHRAHPGRFVTRFTIVGLVGLLLAALMSAPAGAALPETAHAPQTGTSSNWGWE